MFDQRTVLIVVLCLAIAGCDKDDQTRATASVEPSAAPSATQSAPPVQEPQSEPRIARDPQVNPAPLGLEIGYANIEGVRQALAASTSLTDNGTSAYTGGPMLISDGAGLGVDGLSEILFIFDESGVLACVSMTLPKTVNETFKTLATKYQVVDNRIDKFMGYGSASFTLGDSLIRLRADHLSFNQSLVYATKAFFAEYERQVAADAAARKQEQASKL